MSKEFVGVLEAEERGEETFWRLYIGDFTKREWNHDLLIPIGNKDYLKILNHSRHIIWRGEVGKASISPERWAKFFYNNHLAILTKNE